MDRMPSRIFESATMAGRVAMMPAAWLVNHLILGGMLVITPTLYRMLARKVWL
jgi:hypothetical protein